MKLKKTDFWPVSVEDDSHYPRTPDQQVRYVKIYKLYMNHYEKTHDKQACLEFTRRKFGVKPNVVLHALAFTRAVIRALREKEERETTTPS